MAAIVAGVICLIAGAMAFVVGGGLWMALFAIVTIVAWGFALALGNRARKNGHAAGTIGPVLGLIGFALLVVAALVNL